MAPHVLTDGLQFPEGPVWGPNGTLYVTEIIGGRITAIAPNGTKRTFAETSGAVPTAICMSPTTAVKILATFSVSIHMVRSRHSMTGAMASHSKVPMIW